MSNWEWSPAVAVMAVTIASSAAAVATAIFRSGRKLAGIELAVQTLPVIREELRVIGDQIVTQQKDVAVLAERTNHLVERVNLHESALVRRGDL